MDTFNATYPVCETMRSFLAVRWQTGVCVILDGLLREAKLGDRECETRLVNKIGQLKRNTNFTDLNDELKGLVKESVDWLKTTGRVVDLNNKNPSLWISKRDGSPRW